MINMDKFERATRDLDKYDYVFDGKAREGDEYYHNGNWWWPKPDHFYILIRRPKQPKEPDVLELKLKDGAFWYDNRKRYAQRYTCGYLLEHHYRFAGFKHKNGDLRSFCTLMEYGNNPHKTKYATHIVFVKTTKTCGN